MIDFGIAKALAGERLTDRTFSTDRGQAIGTYDAMSPEQADGSPDIDTRTDVYSLGVLLYELLTGAQPFDHATLAKVADQEVRRIIREVEPPRPSTRLASLGGDAGTRVASARRARLDDLAYELRRELEWIPLKAMRKERDRRYASVEQMAGDLGRYLAWRPLLAAPESRAYRLRKFVRRNRGAVTAVASIVVVLAAAVVGAGYGLVSARRERDAAVRARNGEAAALIDAKAAAGQAAAAAGQAAAAAGQAAAAADDARRLLSDSYTHEGLRLLAQDEWPAAALWFLESLRSDDRDRDRRGIHLRRIGAAISASPRRVAGGARRAGGGSGECPVRPDGLLRIDNAESANGGYRVLVLDAATRAPVVPPLPHGFIIAFTTFSPDGRMVATASYDRTARVWDASTGAPITPPLEHAGWTAPAPSDYAVAVWDLSPTTARVARGDGRAEPRGLNQLAITRGGVRFVGDIHENVVQGIHVGNGEPAFRPLKGNAYNARLSDSEMMVATWAGSGPCRVWDAKTGKPVGQPKTTPVREVQFSPDERRLVTCGFDGSAQVFDLPSYEPTTPVLKHTDQVADADFSPDGTLLVTACFGGKARFWKLPGGDAAGPTMEHPTWVLQVRFAKTGERVMTLDEDGTVRVWETSTGRRISEIRNAEAGMSRACLRPDGTRALMPSGNVAKVDEAATGKPVLPTLAHASGVRGFGRFRVTSAEYGTDGNLILTTGTDSRALVWDAKTGWAVGPPIFCQNAREARFSGDASRVFVAAQGSTLDRLFSLLPPSDRIDEMQPHCELLARHRIDETGVLRRLNPAEGDRRFELLRTRWPAVVRPEQGG